MNKNKRVILKLQNLLLGPEYRWDRGSPCEPLQPSPRPRYRLQPWDSKIRVKAFQLISNSIQVSFNFADISNPLASGWCNGDCLAWQSNSYAKCFTDKVFMKSCNIYYVWSTSPGWTITQWGSMPIIANHSRPVTKWIRLSLHWQFFCRISLIFACISSTVLKSKYANFAKLQIRVFFLNINQILNIHQCLLSENTSYF